MYPLFTQEQRDAYSFNALKPMLDHIAANQQRWSEYDATKMEITARQDRMESKLAALQEKLSSIEAVTKATKGKNVTRLGNFEQIGSRFFYIEQHRRVNWFAASKICRQIGGYLAAPRNEEEMSGMQEKLINGGQYWLGISDLADEGMFVSQATGNLAPFLKWFSGEPTNANNKEHCVEIRSDYRNLMNDNECDIKNNFICAAGDE